MADVVRAEGLVIAATDASGNVYPFACAKNSSISISRDVIELAPKTNTAYREFMKGRQTFTVTGDGLVKMAEPNMLPITFFDGFIKSTDASFVAYLDLIDFQGNYKLYKFGCIFLELNLSSSVAQFGRYDFTLQGSGAITELTIVDSYVVSGAGTITGRSTATHKLVAVGIDGKWYYNFVVVGTTITVGTAFSGRTAKAAYIAL